MLIRTIKKLFAFVLLSAAAFSCVDKAVDSTENELLENFAKWKSFGIDSYSVVQSQLCFCVYGGTRAVVIVRNNKIVSVRDSAGVVNILPEHWQWFKTIDEIFESAIKAKNDNPNTFSIQFDERFGFPKYFWVDPRANLADEEFGFTLTNFQPLK